MGHDYMIRRWSILVAILAVLRVATCTSHCRAIEQNPQPAKSDLRIGAIAVDITPTSFPVIVNGMFEERTADRVADPLFARAFVFADGHSRIAIVVVDSCMLPRELLDEAKSRASKLTGIPTDHMLISATHTHSAPSSMGCLGSRPDPQYPSFLVPLLARSIELANERLTPAQIGFAKVHAPNHTFCRSYIRRPDRILKDPFGEPTVRANMHPGFLSPDAVGPTGPVDDELSILAMQTSDAKPLGVLANFSMHYIGSQMVSSDYFGRFAEHLAKRIDGSDGISSCIVSMSQGTSGDLASMNYSAPSATREYDRYADELAELANSAYRQVKYERGVSLAMQEAKLTLSRRVPDAKRLEWAKSMAAEIGDRRPKGWPEVYALEQIMLAAEPERELKLQAVRIGDVAIAAIPNEVFAITGLNLKMQSPLPNTFNIELANGAEGYIPPPEQHKLGGYTSWAARTAGLEVDAEPKIVATLLKLLEDVTGKPRRAIPDSGGPYAAAVLQSKPLAYWRLWEIEGNRTTDVSGNHRDALYKDGVAHFLPGPTGKGFSADGQPGRAVHLAGGRVAADVKDIGTTYSVEFWFWNGIPNDMRPVTGCLFARGPTHDHLVIGGTSSATGHLIFFNSEKPDPTLQGRNTIEPKTWNHVVVVRDGENVWVYLNGQSNPEIVGHTAADPNFPSNDWIFGGGIDSFANLEGKLSEVAVYDRKVSSAEIANHFRAASQ